LNTQEKIAALLRVPVLTRKRIWCAYLAAVLTDTVQLIFGPLGWAVIDQGLDVVAMVITCRALGFHPLLLPTFVLEFIPMADMLPTWTGCTAAVVLLRKKAQAIPIQVSQVITPEPQPPAPPSNRPPALPQGSPEDSSAPNPQETQRPQQ
jgi:hypothetical protein